MNRLAFPNHGVSFSASRILKLCRGDIGQTGPNPLEVYFYYSLTTHPALAASSPFAPLIRSAESIHFIISFRRKWCLEWQVFLEEFGLNAIRWKPLKSPERHKPSSSRPEPGLADQWPGPFSPKPLVPRLTSIF